LEYIQKAPAGNLVIVGRTASTIKRNVVDEIFNLVGSDARHYIGKSEISLWNRRIYLIGCSDERAEQKLRGSTFAGAYVDEATLISESFWTMLLSRLSIPGAKLFATTNPDSPFHYLKKNYIDRSKELDMKTFEFKLDDNPSLTDGFKNNLKLEYQGLWYKRYILGEWCLAEGAIYDFFDEHMHCLEFAPTNPRYYVVGVDYGTTNPCGFGLFGYNPENYPNIWMEEEYYYDSREKMRQKTDSEYCEDLINFMKGKIVKAVVVDPSAASFKAECIKQGIQNIVDANNDVLDGIRFTAKMLSNGTLKICKSCKTLLKEIQSYSWDEKSIKLGEDKPLKTNDHMCDLTRYVLMTYFKQMYDGSKGVELEEYRRWKSQYGWR
jgi:PBSX family phage terminase large subunit